MDQSGQINKDSSVLPHSRDKSAVRTYFVTGLAIFLPLAVTLAIVVYLVDFLTLPFVGIVQPILAWLHLFQNGFLFFSHDQILGYISQGLVLIVLFLFTVLLGALTRWVTVHYFLRAGDYLLERIPVVRTVYKTTQDLTKTILTAKSKSFKQVALVPFPNATQYSIGFVTQENVAGLKEEPLVAVFVPTTPNPTCGFMMLFPKKEVTVLEMSIEDAFKYIISCGVVAPAMNPFVSSNVASTAESGGISRP